MTRWKKSHRIIAVTVALILVAQVVFFSMDNALWFSNSSAEGAAQDADAAHMAADISNLTGATTEEILELYNAGLSWNSIMELLKNGSASQQQRDQTRRGVALMETGLSEETVTQLLKEGYIQEQITEAKLIAERVAFQLKELTGDAVSDQDSNIESFRRVAEQFILSDAVRWMLVLGDAIGGMELVLDEYLSTLQYGLDLLDFQNDKEAYMNIKEQRKLERLMEAEVTLAEIERKLLQKIQEENEKQRDDAFAAPSSIQEKGGIGHTAVEPPLPDPPDPNPKDVKPVDPAKSIMQEIELINPNLNQYELRGDKK